MEMQIMTKKIDNKGLSLVELIISIAIMAILVGVLAPQMVKYVEKARKVKIEKEASEFMRAAQVALVEVTSQGKEPQGDSIHNKIKIREDDKNNPFYKDKAGKLYGNLTNWTFRYGVVTKVVDGKVINATNAPFADEFFKLLGISYGETEWKSGKTPIPISGVGVKGNEYGSLTKECKFQVFYDGDGNMIIEYSRQGYFVRMENSILVLSEKIKDAGKKYFTSWQE